jgi:hypothetical protein
VKVYIQSKSGNYNVVIDNLAFSSLLNALKYLRASGGYTASSGSGKIEWFVPFEQIEAIREAQSDD